MPQTSIKVPTSLHQYQNKQRLSATALSSEQHWDRGEEGSHTH